MSNWATAMCSIWLLPSHWIPLTESLHIPEIPSYWFSFVLPLHQLQSGIIYAHAYLCSSPSVTKIVSVDTILNECIIHSMNLEWIFTPWFSTICCEAFTIIPTYKRMKRGLSQRSGWQSGSKLIQVQPAITALLSTTTLSPDTTGESSLSCCICYGVK